MSETLTVTATVVQVGVNFEYDLTIHNTGTTTIGSMWIGWTPGSFYLPSAPIAHDQPTGWSGNVVTFGKSSIQFVAGSATSDVAAGGALSGFSFTTPDSPAVLFGPSTPPDLSSFAYSGGIEEDLGVEFVVACFAAGTRVATARGEVPVQALAIGDLVPTLVGGRLAPVRWLGHRAIDCRRHPRPEAVWPVRVRAGAFGPARPADDLLLSPDHAVFVDGSLIPIRYLVNGATIAQEAVDHVEYWHVELPTHEVLLAEGLAVESYLDTGNRSCFANGGPALLAHPDFSLAVWATDACAPLVTDGPALAAARGKLLARYWDHATPSASALAAGDAP